MRTNDRARHRATIPCRLAVAVLCLNLSCLDTDTRPCGEDGRCPANTACVTLESGELGCVDLGECGNHYLDEGESCDDGNRIGGDGCSRDCSSTEYCGNGTLDPEIGEVCDCGSDSVAPAAECLGQQNSAEGGLCRLDCLLHCGDGELAPAEECEGGVIRTGFQCQDLGYDFGHTHCAPGCGGVDLSECGTYGWRAMATPTSTWVRNIWGSADDDIWAVGTNGLILHYDGRIWREVASETAARLRGIWGLGADAVYTVGDVGTILRYDGSAWTPMASGTSENLRAVWGIGPEDIYAVGESGTILRYDGNAWIAMVTPVVTTLRDIWGAAPDDLHVVGSFGTILHYDGQSWRTVASPTGASVQNIWGDPAGSGAIFAVANGGEVLQYDGQEWRIIWSGVIQNDLIAIWADSPDELYVVGEGGVIVRYHDGAWELIPSSTTSDLDGVWGSQDGDVYAAGENGSLLQFSRVSWRALENPTSGQTLRDVWGSAADDVYMVGSGGTILRYDGQAISAMTTPADTGRLYSVWGSRPDDVYAVGECGVVLHHDGVGDAWSPVAGVPASGDLYAIWGAGERDIFIAGAGGALLHYDGASWEAMLSPTDEPLFGIGGSGPDDVIAVGANGALLHYDGTIWRWQHSRTSNPLYGVWSANVDHVVVVGENRTALRRVGDTWQLIRAPAPTDWLRGVWGTAPDDIFAVGETGTVLHYDGVSWAPIRSGEDSNLYAVWAAPTGEAFAVGSGGVVYKLQRESASTGGLSYVCGDHFLEYGEECDDGNAEGGDGCDANCRREPVCGNDALEAGELCDDGNRVPGDGCDADCALEGLAESEPNEDGSPEPGGVAIVGNDFSAQNANGPFSANTTIIATLEPVGDEDVFAIENTDTAARTVQIATYNSQFGLHTSCNTSLDTVLHIRDEQGASLAYNDNRVQDPRDACASVGYQIPAGRTVYAHVSDFGDDAAFPAPTYALVVEFTARCGDGVVGGLEECEDGNASPGDGCSPTCRMEYQCGDGALDPREHCDDGNTSSGDGCSSTCTLELDAATSIDAPGAPGVAFAGSLDASDWRWARPHADCNATWPADHYLDVFSVRNDTGEDQALSVTASWNDADGHVHVYADPLDPTTVNGCIGGDDEYLSFGSQMTDVPISAGETVHIMASTYAGESTIAAYTVVVATQPVNQCSP